MSPGSSHRPWYVWLVRLIAVACVSFILWVSAVASPFLMSYILGLDGTANRLMAAAAFAGSLAVIIGFFCYLFNRF